MNRYLVWSHPAVCRLVVVGCVSAAVLAGVPGCASPGKKKKQVETTAVELVDVLEDDMQQFLDFFQATVERAAMELERKATSQEERRAVSTWRLTSTSECRRVTNQPDPRQALLDVWTLCQAMLDFFEQGKGRSLFGENHALALEAAREVHSGVEGIAQRDLPPELFESSRERIVAFAKEHPLQHDFSGRPEENFSETPDGVEQMKHIASVPLAPFTVLSGLGKTPDSVREVSVSMNRFTDVAEEFPANARWQVQLLAMNLEELPSVVAALDSFKQISDNTTRLTTIAEEMPGKIRTETEELLDRAAELQPELRSTLAEAVEAADKLESVSREATTLTVEARSTIEAVQDASTALEQTAEAVTVTVHEILKFVPASSKDETGQILGKPASDHQKPPADSADLQPAVDGQPDTEFSFQAVTASAEALGETTDKLQGLMVDLREFVDSGSVTEQVRALDAQVTETLDETTLRLNGVIDHLAKRSVQVLVLLFVLLVIYQLLRVRLQRRSGLSPA